MGQYYLPTLQDVNGDGSFKTFHSHEYDNGLKLMEHSYIGNNFVAAVLSELVDKPMALWWLGDYTEDEDFIDGRRLHNHTRISLWNCEGGRVMPTDENQEWVYDGAFVLNHTTKEYIKLHPDSDDLIICPVCLLTAVGNGKGCGDYCGEHEYFVGIWAGMELQVVFNENEIPQDFTDETDRYVFEEDR